MGSCSQPPAQPPPAPDMACPPIACTVEDGEDCVACFTKIGDCCYGDHQWGGPKGTFDLLVAKCQESSACVACCNECAALTCRQMQTNRVCPFIDPSVKL